MAQPAKRVQPEPQTAMTDLGVNPVRRVGRTNTLWEGVVHAPTALLAHSPMRREVPASNALLDYTAQLPLSANVVLWVKST
jgi:hypothetical protein